MAKTKDETASVAIRVYPRTRKKINIIAAKQEKTIAEIVDDYFA